VVKAYLDTIDISKLERTATNLRDRLLIRLLFHLGCRVSEALGLTIDDIDFSTGTVRIQHLKSRIQLNCSACGSRLGKNHMFCPKCGKDVIEAVKKALEHRRMRTLPVDEETLDILEDFINRGGPIKIGDKTFIFGISRHRAWQVVKKYAEQAGLPRLMNAETGKVHNVTPHKLRDAFAVNAMKLDNTGDGLRLLQEYLGHVSFNSTAKYRKVSGEESKNWYRKLWQSPEVKNDKGKSS